MKVGVLGSGEVGRALSHGFLATGHSVRLGTRSPKDSELVEWSKTETGPLTLGTFSEAADFGELLVLAVRGAAVGPVLELAGSRHFDGKVVIDVTNPLVMDERGPPTLSVGHTSSAGEQLQARLPKARVVKAFNIVGNPSMFRPDLPGGPPDMILCGNDAEAKATVAGIVGEFGWPPPIDIGGIEGSRELESLCVLWVKCAMSLQNFQIAFRLLRK